MDLISFGDWKWRLRRLSEHTVTHTIQSEKCHSPVCEQVEMSTFHFLPNVSRDHRAPEQCQFFSLIKRSSYFWIEELRNTSPTLNYNLFGRRSSAVIRGLLINQHTHIFMSQHWPDTIFYFSNKLDKYRWWERHRKTDQFEWQVVHAW